MNEEIQLAIYGISKTAKTERPSMSGVGVIVDIENTIIVTDKRLLFIAVPVSGEGMTLGGMDVSGMQSMFNRKNIEKRGSEMINRMPPQEILKSNPANFEIPFEYITEVKFGWFGTVKILDSEGEKYRYTIFKKEDREKLKQVLQRFIPNKIR